MKVQITFVIRIEKIVNINEIEVKVKLLNE